MFQYPSPLPSSRPPAHASVKNFKKALSSKSSKSSQLSEAGDQAINQHMGLGNILDPNQQILDWFLFSGFLGNRKRVHGPPHFPLPQESGSLKGN